MPQPPSPGDPGLRSALGQAQFWVLEAERNLLALQWLLSLKQHIGELAAALERSDSGVSVTPLPEHFPWNYGEGMTLLYGNLGRDHWDEHPPDLAGLIEALRRSIAKSLDWRWTETLAWEEAVRRFGDREFEGEDIAHPNVQRTIEELRPKLRSLADIARSAGVTVEFNDPDEQTIGACVAEMKEQPQ